VLPASTIRGILFDLDGTLLDTSADLISACNTAIREFGLSSLPASELKPQISGGALAMLHRTLTHPDNAEIEVDVDLLLDRMLDLYEHNIAVHTRLFDGMDKVLQLLESSGLPWGIVTNKVERFTAPLLRALEFDRQAGCVVSGDTYPEKKPHPMPMLAASRQLGCKPEECVYIGDSRRDIEAGRNAGMLTLAASYGYVDDSDPAHTWGADGIIDHPERLAAWLTARIQP
jgi:phosphoglycolate phosphatase